MRRKPSSTAVREAQSLMLKMLGYESESKRRKRALGPPLVSLEEATKLAHPEGIKLLRQVSRRVDGFLRERRDQSDALLSVVRLREFGVLPKHIPVLPSARTLAHVCNRGYVASRREAELVSCVLKNTDLLLLLGKNSEALGDALDSPSPLATKVIAARRPNPSIERTRPGKQGRASHVKR